MEVAEGFGVSLVASEPEIRQPLSIAFDERGRMWVIQYLQYPKPAGLKPVKVDQYLRTKYDRVPEPPPRGVKGADLITICDDTDGDGRADKFTDFVTGLNLCSGMVLGHGGVFVAQPPYLLFYADRNRDDIPDGDPEVLLSGFGIEDAHALANSLTWGPDGWLYGAQGSTVTANIRGIEFQQGIWRYHPLTREFELFAEGGGNTWGLDFDAQGELVAGTNFDDKMLHQVQGAYYVKNFGKHGELHNPHAYGYFGHVPYSGYRGAHLSVGGIVYLGGAFADSFRGTYISANMLDRAIYWYKLAPQGSSFTANFGGPLIKTDEELFRPVDCQTGPDGAVYIADWCDKRATHVDPLDTWDRSNGRIYRIQAKGAKPVPKFDLASLSSDKLVDLLAHQNDWFAREARRILSERRDRNTYARLESQISGNDPRLALQSLWALYAGGGFNNTLASALLQHRDENVRAWTIRLLGDARQVTPTVQSLLVTRAKTDTSPIVRRQLACTVKRLPGTEALPILNELLSRDEDVDDPQIPLLLWWAIEHNTIAQRENLMRLLASPAAMARPLMRKTILERLARRYAAEGSEANFASCAQLLKAAPSPVETAMLLRGMELGIVSRRFDNTPATLAAWFTEAWMHDKRNVDLMRLGLRLGDERARRAAVEFLDDPRAEEKDRIEIVETLGQSEEPGALPKLLVLVTNAPSLKLRNAALSALQHFPDPGIAVSLVAAYDSLSPELRSRVRSLLCSRPAWAHVLVARVEGGIIPAKDVTLDEARQMARLQDAQLTQRLEKIWGKIKPDSPEEKQNFMNEVKLVLKPSGAAARDGRGNRSEGRKIFTQACGICHKLFEEGTAIGPDLTTADRRTTDMLLQNIVNPSAYIRPEFVNHEAVTRDEQSISGLLVESSPAAVTLLDRNNQRHVLPRERLASLRESEMSLMPDGLLEALSPQQIMDLFSYLQGEGIGAAEAVAK